MEHINGYLVKGSFQDIVNAVGIQKVNTVWRHVWMPMGRVCNKCMYSLCKESGVPLISMIWEIY